MEQDLFKKRALTKAKVVHKDLSQDFNQITGSRSKRITQPFHNIKVVYVAFMIILHFMKNLICHNVSIQKKLLSKYVEVTLYLMKMCFFMMLG